MTFVLSSSYTIPQELADSCVVYPDFDKSRFMWRLVSRLGKEHSAAISADLNRINNQGIEEIVPEQFYYLKGGEKLPLQCLSTGERIFLLGYASLHLNTPVVLYHGFNQLSDKSKRLFCQLYGSAAMTVVCKTEAELLWCNRIQGGELDDYLDWKQR